MSLADELLLDLDGDSDGALSDHEQTAPPQAGPSSFKPSGSGGGLMLPPPTLPSKRKALEDSLDGSGIGDNDGDADMEGADGLVEVPEGGVRPTEELDKDAVEQMALGEVDDVKKVARLLGSKKLEDTLRVSI